MNCIDVCQPDCRHLEMHDEYWVCGIHGFKTIDSQIDGCSYYEAPGEYALRIALQGKFDSLYHHIAELDEWRDRYIRRGVIAGVITLTAYAIFVWMLT